MSGDFTKQILSDKLAKLNNSQQSIQTLSNWCIFHRKRASQIVSIWESNFHEAAKSRKLPLLYLANDILQNSRRKGPEFVNEFWKTLPPAVAYMIENGDSSSRSAAMRLIDIWEERKVFGSFTENLREIIMGRKHPSVRDKKTSEQLTSKSEKNLLSGPLEKLASAYSAIQEISAEEELSIKKSQSLILELQAIEADADARASSGQMNAVAEELTRQQGQLARTSAQLEMCEKKRNNLVNLLQEALRTQESKLERVRNQIQLVQTRAENALNLRHRLLAVVPKMEESSEKHNENTNSIPINENDIQKSENNNIENSTEPITIENNDLQHSQQSPSPDSLYSPTMPSFSSPFPPPAFSSSLPSTPYITAPLPDSSIPINDHESEEDIRKRNEAAEVAAKLTASASSVAMLSSVLSSLAQENENGSSTLGAVFSDLAASAPPDKRQKISGPSDPRAVPSDTRLVPSDPRSMPADPRTMPADPRTMPADPRTVPADPRTVPSDPRTMPSDPRTMPADPRSVPSDAPPFTNHSANHYAPIMSESMPAQLPPNQYFSGQHRDQNQNQVMKTVMDYSPLGVPGFDAYGGPAGNLSQPMMLPHQANQAVPPGFNMQFSPGYGVGSFYTAPLPPPPAPRPPS